MRRQIGCIALMIVWMSVGGCMNAGYTYKVTSVNVDGMLPLKAEGARLVKKERFGLWDMSAMRAVDRYVNEAGIWGTSVSVNVKKKGCSNDSPLFCRFMRRKGRLTRYSWYIRRERRQLKWRSRGMDSCRFSRPGCCRFRDGSKSGHGQRAGRRL